LRRIRRVVCRLAFEQAGLVVVSAHINDIKRGETNSASSSASTRRG
jgi:hypothetical protein